jgi:23S rRNA pseudouridine1911/1915/1917 synthase
MRVVVTDGLDGIRADRAVAVLCEVSRSVAKRTMEGGGVTRDGETLEPADTVSAGDALTVALDQPETEVAPDDTVELVVAYEDDEVLVVDKPAGLVVHPGAGVRSGTLVGGLLAHRPWAAELGPDLRWGIVHRLDRDTSGLLMVAKTPRAHAALQDALRQRRVKRRYLALATGAFASATGTIEAPVGRDPVNPTRMTVVAGGRPARTHYRVVASWQDPELTLLSLDLETGRTHQIRVHLRSIDRPIVGDETYGPIHGSAADPGRTWLHAAELVFPHPSGSGEVGVTSPLPAELAASLDDLGEPLLGAVPQ